MIYSPFLKGGIKMWLSALKSDYQAKVYQLSLHMHVPDCMPVSQSQRFLSGLRTIER